MQLDAPIDGIIAPAAASSRAATRGDPDLVVTIGPPLCFPNTRGRRRGRGRGCADGHGGEIMTRPGWRLTTSAAAVLSRSWSFRSLVAGQGYFPDSEVPAEADVVHMMSHIFAHPEWARLDRFFH